MEPYRYRTHAPQQKGCFKSSSSPSVASKPAILGNATQMPTNGTIPAEGSFSNIVTTFLVWFSVRKPILGLQKMLKELEHAPSVSFLESGVANIGMVLIRTASKEMSGTMISNLISPARTFINSDSAHSFSRCTDPLALILRHVCIENNLSFFIRYAKFSIKLLW